LEEPMSKRELFSWATSVVAGIPVAALMIYDLYVFAAVIAVLLAVSGIALMFLPESRPDCTLVFDEGKLSASDSLTVRTEEYKCM
jgi:hypothetical protein